MFSIRLIEAFVAVAFAATADYSIAELEKLVKVSEKSAMEAKANAEKKLAQVAALEKETEKLLDEKKNRQKKPPN
jgi:hypothetical protein